MKTITNNTTPDELFCRFNENTIEARMHAAASTKQLRLVKSCMYRAAVQFTSLQAQHREWLLQMIKSIEHFTDSPDPLTAWLDDQFLPLTIIGERWCDLLKAVYEGMTLPQYLSQSPAMFVATKKAKQVAPDDLQRAVSRLSPSRPRDVSDLALRKRLQLLQGQYVAAQEQIVLLKNRLLAAQQKINELTNEARKILRNA